jgi:spermidine synthase
MMLTSSTVRGRALVAAVTVAASMLGPFVLPAWDRELLSGGMYKYAAYLREGEVLDFLRRGELVFYKEGKVATVSVKQIGSEVSLAIDGKVDATNAADMLTQRLLAHVPLLLHPAPRDVCVIGHGSGVTAGSALTHPIERLDTIEISPGVIEGSGFFEKENGNALENERLHLFVTDARNHLLLTDKTYDVIISEPSNPWMAGVSQLFTRDFFELARTRLTPNGLFCQWGHIYNMAEDDLKTIVAGFTDAFQEAVLFLVNEGDILLVGTNTELPSIDPDALARRMSSETVREDLASVEVRNPFAFASLYTVSTPALSEWASDAARHTDDHPVLEFRAPRHMHADTGPSNRRAILEVADGGELPPAISQLRSNPTAEDLVSRARMLERSDSFAWAFETYVEAARKRPDSLDAHEGITRTAIAIEQPELGEEAMRSFVKGTAATPLVAAHIGLALLYRNTGRYEEALQELETSLNADPDNVRALLLASEFEGEVGRTDLMEELARIAMAVRPEDPEAEALVAEAGLRRGEPELGLSLALSILERHPEQTRALQVTAIAYAQMEDYASSRLVFKKLTELEPNAWIHFNNFAQLEMESNNFQAAADLYERSVDINPRNVQGYMGLRDTARIAGNAKQLERALTMLAVLGVQQ